jgi:predicted O-methyltransferase YrrM
MASINDIQDNYISDHSTPEDQILKELARETNLSALYPRMLSGHIQGMLLTMLCRMLKPSFVLEIGTYTGYSAICMARGLEPDGTLHTIEINDELRDMSLKYFRKAGLENKITLLTGDALEIIPALNYSYNLVFIDGAKHEYLQYYNAVFSKVREGGFIIADNVLWDGKVLLPGPYKQKETRGIATFNDALAEDDRTEKIMVPLRDGLTIIRKLRD